MDGFSMVQALQRARKTKTNKGFTFYMTKKDVEADFRENMMPRIREIEQSQSGSKDEPLRAQTWNDYVDGLIKDKMVSSRAEAWVHPRWL